MNVFHRTTMPPVTWAMESIYQALLGGGKNGTMLTMPWGVSQLRPCPGVLGDHLDLLGQEKEIQSPPHPGTVIQLSWEGAVLRGTPTPDCLLHHWRLFPWQVASVHPHSPKSGCWPPPPTHTVFLPGMGGGRIWTLQVPLPLNWGLGPPRRRVWDGSLP